MIDFVGIHNFKSIVDLDIELGRFNVIIGPNGCGKSNILEAISFVSAASQDKLDNEYMLNRDIRLTDPQFMVNAFEVDDDEEETEDISKEELDNPDAFNYLISIKIGSSAAPVPYNIKYVDDMKKWVNFTYFVSKALYSAFEDNDAQPENIRLLIDKFQNDLSENGVSSEVVKNALRTLFNPSTEFASFLTYRPTEHFLRKTFETSLFPLGVHGEGLLKYLKEKASEGDMELFENINEGLKLLDWFDGFRIPEDLMTNEYRLLIGDRYLKDSLHYFDQRSTNEGFLFILFYLTLFNSKDTPSFFAVDNIESALNPKLQTKLMEYLIDRTINNGKQVIVTTHSPFVLDALDLKNDDIRLFVARRNIDGHTRLERVPYREERKMKLSMLWMSGLIGGLPDNF